MNQIIIVTLLCISLFGCASSKQQNNTKNGKDDVDLSIKDKESEVIKETLFYIKAGECSGSCPVFEFRLYEDSSASLLSEKNLFEKGSYISNVSPNEYEELSLLIKARDWSKLKNEYPSDMLDLPSYYFEIALGQDSYSTKVDGLLPPQLKNFPDEVVNWIKSIQWKKE